MLRVEARRPCRVHQLRQTKAVRLQVCSQYDVRTEFESANTLTAAPAGCGSAIGDIARTWSSCELVFWTLLVGE
eukprot:3594565-Prymnesium_polylepis.2